MTEEKVEQLLELGRTLKEELVIVTKAQLRVFVDFSDEKYKDTHIFNNYLYVWDADSHRCKIVLLEDIEFIEFY